MVKLIIQDREVPLAGVSEFRLTTEHGTIHLVGVDAREAVAALLRGDGILPNRAPPPPHPRVDNVADCRVGDTLFCVNPGFPEQWILICTSDRMLGILADGKGATVTRAQWMATSQDWHRTRPSLEWLAEQEGLGQAFLDNVRKARLEVIP